MATRQVAVTGLGLMTGLGLDLETSWQAMLKGARATKRFTLFDPDGLACPFGVELPDGAEDVFARRIKRRRRSQMTRGTMLAVVTADMAWEDAAIDTSRVDPARVGVVVGTCGTGYVAEAGGALSTSSAR